MESSPPATQQQRMAALAPWAAKEGNLLAIEVPAASSTLSNQMVIAALKAGSSSNAADQIVQMLRTGQATTLAIMGNNLAVNAATLQSALKKWSATGGHTATMVLLVGEPDDAGVLKETAMAAGVRLEIAPIH